MYNKVQFEGDFIKAYGYLGVGAFKTGRLTPPAVRYIDFCYSVYNNAATNKLEALVVGRIVKRDGTGTRINLEKVGYGLDDDERTNFITTKAGKDGVGSVLGVDGSDWELSLNDSWLMGGIHARHDFYLASPRTKDNILDSTYGATVTGRELLGLTTFGYTLHPNTRLGEVYVCTDRARALAATFVAYQKAFDAARAGGGFSQLVNTNTS